MKVCIQQPQYLPYIGFFNKLMNSDVCVILDDAAYSKNDFFNRNKIRTAKGWCWLTVPVHANANQAIKDVKIANNINWREKHLKSIQCNYGNAPHFNEHEQFFNEYYSKSWGNLSELDIHSLKYLANALKIKTQFVTTSELKITSTSTQRLIDICKKIGGDTYISGSGGKDYMDTKLFEKNGIALAFQEFEHPTYKQAYGGFEKHMSIIDLLFNLGKDSIGIIRNSGGICYECTNN